MNDADIQAYIERLKSALDRINARRTALGVDPLSMDYTQAERILTDFVLCLGDLIRVTAVATSAMKEATEAIEHLVVTLKDGGQ